MLKNILVAYNGLPGSDAALKGAVQVQQRFDTDLTGLFAHGNPFLSRQLHKAWMPQKMQDAIVEAADSPSDDIREKFDEICQVVPAEKKTWINSGGSVQTTVTRYSRLFDLTILGMHEKSFAHNLSHLELFPDRIALESGRPVLVFPSNPPVDCFDKTIVIAWDGKRAAARALADAKLFLKAGHNVDLVSIGRMPLAEATPGVDIGKLFKNHGWNVTISEIPLSKKTISQILVEYCRNVDAGLLVMGAYEHSPLREGLFGGVTQDISLGAEIPVLMSH